MKSLSFRELDMMVEMAESFEGFFVQEAVLSRDVLMLFLRRGSKEAYLITDAGGQRPVFIATQEPLAGFKKETKPIILFLRKHLLGKKLVLAQRRAEFGRLVVLRFEAERSESWVELELHLFQQARNIVARMGEGAKTLSQLSLNKTKPIQEVVGATVDDSPRSPSQVYADWLAARQPVKGKGAVADPAAAFEKIKAKKMQGLEALREKLATLSDESLRQAGEWLSAEQTLEVPLEFAKHVDVNKSLRANIADIFEKIKANKKKIESVEERLRFLENELKNLSPASVVAQGPRKKPPASPLEGAKGRTQHFANGVSAFIGKSAADNLKILRRAKAWYWWVHPKDMPGSHAIIAIDKGAKLDGAILKKVALWTLQETLSDKQWKDWQGVKTEFLYTECRFVTPIKGDKLGRVHYKNEKTLTLVVG